MYRRLLACLIVALLPGLTWADSWKDEGGRRWGWGRKQREPHAEPPPQAPAKGFWGGFLKHSAPAPAWQPEGDGQGVWQKVPAAPGCACGANGAAAQLTHPPTTAPVVSVPPVGGAAPPLAAPEPVPQPAPAVRLAPVPQPAPPSGIGVSGPRPLPLGPAQEPPLADPTQGAPVPPN